MSFTINQTLLDLAAWRIAEAEKRAFVPPAGDPAAGGAPPMDPSMGGGAPPMDPSMMGGAPPVDPAAMGGGAPPDAAGGPGASGGDLMSALMPMITQAVQQAVQAAMGGGGAPGAAGPGVAGPGKGAKIDPGMIYMELGRMRKLMTGFYQKMGWELPPDILNDDMVAQSIAGAPTSAPLDPAQAGAPAPAPAGPEGLPGIGQSPGINPIAPPGGEPKMASILELFQGHMGRAHAPVGAAALATRTDALAELARSLARNAR